MTGWLCQILNREDDVTDADKLRKIADWFDMEEKTDRWLTGNREVQEDLRRIADILDGYDICDACGKSISDGNNVGVECNLHPGCVERVNKIITITCCGSCDRYTEYEWANGQSHLCCQLLKKYVSPRTIDIDCPLEDYKA